MSVRVREWSCFSCIVDVGLRWARLYTCVVMGCVVLGVVLSDSR